MYNSVWRAIGHSAARDDEEDQREGRQHQRQGDLVGRALADGPFDQGDHAIEERFAGPAVISHDDAVGQHARAAGDAGAVAARLADDRGRLAGDGRLIDGGDAGDDLAVAGDDLPRLRPRPDRPRSARVETVSSIDAGIAAVQS